jgi:hypothetical protein
LTGLDAVARTRTPDSKSTPVYRGHCRAVAPRLKSSWSSKPLWGNALIGTEPLETAPDIDGSKGQVTVFHQVSAVRCSWMAQ